MGFGSSAKKPAAKAQGSTSTKKNIFFDTKVGLREFRVMPGDEIRFKELFFAREPDGTWVPAFGYDPNDQRTKKPVTIALFDPEAGDDGTWEYGGAYGKSPIDEYVAAADVTDDVRKKMYPSEKFMICVLDRTQSKTDANSAVHLPDARSKFPESLNGVLATRINAPKILQGSSGRVRDENGALIGEHMYTELLKACENEMNAEGDLLPPSSYDMRLVTSPSTSPKSNKLVRRFSPTGNKEEIDWTLYHTFDLRTWKRPWSHEAIRTLMDGAEYNDVLTLMGYSFFPVEMPIPTDENPF